MIKIVCPACKSDDVRLVSEVSGLQHLYFQCNEKGCGYNKEYVFTATNDSIKVE